MTTDHCRYFFHSIQRFVSLFTGNGLDDLDPFGEPKSRKSSGFSEGHGSGKSRQFSGFYPGGSLENGHSNSHNKSRNCSGGSGSNQGGFNNGSGTAPVSIPPGLASTASNGGSAGAGSGNISAGQTPPNHAGPGPHAPSHQLGMFGGPNQLGLVDLTTPTKAPPPSANNGSLDTIARLQEELQSTKGLLAEWEAGFYQVRIITCSQVYYIQSFNQTLAFCASH